jgi:hypothetical protein
MQTKICSKCKVEKDVTEFSKSKSGKDGLQNWCRVCAKQYRIENGEALREYDRQHYLANREAHREQARKYRIENREAISEYQSRYYFANREALRENARQYCAKNWQRTLWSNILKRCLNPRRHDYVQYGGRGITVCPDWVGPQGLENFKAVYRNPRPPARRLEYRPHQQ